MCIYRVSSLSTSFSYRSTCLTTSQIYKLNEQYNSIYGISCLKNITFDNSSFVFVVVRIVVSCLKNITFDNYPATIQCNICVVSCLKNITFDNYMPGMKQSYIVVSCLKNITFDNTKVELIPSMELLVA